MIMLLGSEILKFQKILFADTSRNNNRRQRENGQERNVRNWALNNWKAGKWKKVRKGLRESDLHAAQYSITSHKETLNQLHPEIAPENRWTGQVESTTLKTLPFDADSVRATLSSLPSDSAKGVSGWTNKAIKSIFLSGNELTDTMDCLFNMFKSMFLGDLDRDLWTSSRSVLIPKRDTTKFRPLGIGESFFRFLGKMVCHSLKDDCDASFAPLQLGCGISGGAEIAARLVQLSMEADANVYAVAVDLENAFNCVKRETIYGRLKNRFQRLRKFFRWVYGGGNQLYNSQGEKLVTVNEGVMQGDPLSALYFCLAVQPCLGDINKHLKTIHTGPQRRNNGTFSGRVVAYMDDVTILVHGSLVDQIITKTTEVFGKEGLSVNQTKTVIIRGNTQQGGIEQYHGTRATVEAATILGVPIGHCQSAREDFLRGMEEGIMKELDDLDNVDVHKFIKFNLIRSSINTTLNYISRIYERGPSYQSFADRIDQRVDLSIARIAEISLPVEPIPLDCFQILRELPQRQAGLGIGRHGGIAGEKAVILSRFLTRNFVRKHYQTDNGLIEAAKKWEFLRLDGILDRMGMEEGLGGSWWDETVLYAENNGTGGAAIRENREAILQKEEYDRMVRDATAEIYKGGVDLVLDLLSDRCWKSWVRSSVFRGSGRWLAGVSDNLQGEFQFIKDNHYVIALKLRLAVDPTLIPHESCPLCGKEQSALHLMNCDESQWYWTNRHNAVRDILVKAIKAKGLKPEPEKKVGNKADGSAIRADIVYKACEFDLMPYLLDVAIVNPGAPSYAHLNPEVESDAVAKDKEKEKDEAYISVATRYMIRPFVVEATGRLGPLAREWLKQFEKNPWERAKIRELITCKIQQFNCSQIRLLRQKAISLCY